MTIIDPPVSIGHLRIIYNEYRTALLNKKYYGYRLQKIRRYNFWLEVLITVGASGSTGIAGLTIWKQGAGITAWAIISGVSIFLAGVKPFLGLPAQIERYGKLWGEFASMYEGYRSIEQDCSANNCLSSD